MTEKITLIIGEKKFEIGKLDIVCDDCEKELLKLDQKDISKIVLYECTIHQDSGWHLEVM